MCRIFFAILRFFFLTLIFLTCHSFFYFQFFWGVPVLPSASQVRGPPAHQHTCTIGSIIASKRPNLQSKASMSGKRKAEEISASTGRSSSGGSRKTATLAHGWADLPAELVQGIGVFHDKPRDLASMERTCRSWRKVVMEGNGDMKIPDVSDLNSAAKTVCLWRDLAMAKFPAVLPSIVKALKDFNEESSSDSRANSDDDDRKNFSWKSLYRSQFCVVKRGESHPNFRPKTSCQDYIFSYEFRRFSTEEILFVTSAVGDVTPELWDQDIFWDGVGLPQCKGPVDPKLVAHLGDDPFSEKKLKNIDIRVVVTRISDMKAVELTSSLCLASKTTEKDVNYDEGGCCVLIWKSIRFRHNPQYLWSFEQPSSPRDYVANEYVILPSSGGHDVKWTLRLEFHCDSGCIYVGMEKHIVLWDRYGDLGGAHALDCDDERILEYLETRCPFDN